MTQGKVYKSTTGVESKSVIAHQFNRTALSESIEFAGDNYVDIYRDGELKMALKNTNFRSLEKDDEGYWLDTKEDVFEDAVIYEYCWIISNADGTLTAMKPNDFWKKYKNPVGAI